MQVNLTSPVERKWLVLRWLLEDTLGPEFMAPPEEVVPG